MKRSLRRFKNTRGFTLVELVVVLVLVSIVSAIAIPSYLGYVDDTHEKQCEMNMKRLASYLDDMRVTSSSADMTDVLAAHPEIQCPSGGTYYVPDAGSAAAEDGSADKGAASVVKCDKHSDLELVVATRDGGLVTADAKPGSGTTEEPAPPATEEKKPENNAGSGSGSETEAQPTLTVTVSPNPQTIEVGQKCTLTANFDVTGGAADDSTIQWTSDNPSVAVVTGDGSRAAEITASAAGTYQITCTATAFSPNKTQQKSGSGNATVTVNKQKIDGVKLNVTPSSVTLGRGETTQLKAVVDPAVSCTYQWVCTNGSGVSIVSGQDTNTLTVKGDTAGASAVFTCTAIPNDPVKEVTNASLTADATVTVKKDPVTLNLSINPSSVTVNEGGTVTLTANLSGGSVTGCTYKWTSSDPSAVELMENNTQSVTVKGVKKSEGPVNITCTAVPTVDSSMELQNGPEIKAGAQVRVEEKEMSGDLLKDISEPLLINGVNKGIDIGPYEKVTTGEWTSDNSSIVECSANSKWLTAKGKGFCNLTYTVNGKYQTIQAKVVYPHMHLNVRDVPNNDSTVRVNDTVTLTAEYDNTSTDGPVYWENQSPDIISISPEGENSKTAKVTAISTGTASIRVKLQNEYTKTWTEVPVSYPVYTNLTGIRIEPQTYKLTVGNTASVSFAGEGGDIEIHPVPEEASLEGASIKCESRSLYHVNVLNSGELKGLNAADNNITIHVIVSKDGSDYTGDFTVNVKQDPSALSQIGVNTMNLTMGQEACAIPFWTNPSGIDLSDFTFQYSEYNTECIQINQVQNTIKPLKVGKTRVAVEAWRNGKSVQKFNFDVIVSSINEIWSNLNNISLKVEQEQDVQIMWRPENADVSDIVFEISDWTPEAVEITPKGNGKFTLKGIRADTHWLTARAKLEDGTVLKECGLQVTVSAENESRNEPSTVKVEGIDVNLTPWDQLKEQLKTAIQNGTVGELSHSLLFLYYPNGWDWKIYILAENINLQTWDSSYDSMTFDQFRQANPNMFYELSRYYVIAWPDNLSGVGSVQYSYGQLIKRNGHLYVALRAINGKSDWTEEDFNSYFALLQ